MKGELKRHCSLSRDAIDYQKLLPGRERQEGLVGDVGDSFAASLSSPMIFSAASLTLRLVFRHGFDSTASEHTN